MKKQFIWEEEDIISGRYVVRGNFLNATTAFKIGYYYDKHAPDSDIEQKRNLVRIAITDGMVTSTETAKEMAESLTSQGYRPLSARQLLKFIEELEVKRENDIEDGAYGK
jgi:hypothetical protein